MSRAIWNGTIAFGLVEVPVSLHSAEKAEETVRFRLLDRRSMKPVGNLRVNQETGEEVPWEEVVRGYEYEKGEFVVLTDEELRRANVEKSESIDIVGFVDLADIDPMYFEKPYYLKPAKKGSRGYSLLRATLEETGKAGIATIVLRTRQRVAALLPRGPALALVMLRYAEEVRTPASLEIEEPERKEGEVGKKELALARQLVEGMAMKWQPARFKDEYKDEVLHLVDRKIKAGKTEEVLLEPKKERPKKDVLDLMPLLEKSLAQRPKGKLHRARPRRARKGA